MKKLYVILLSAVCAFALLGCGGEADLAPEPELEYEEEEPEYNEEDMEAEEDFEDYSEDAEDTAYDEADFEGVDVGESDDQEFEMEYGEEANEPTEEPAEGLSDQVLMKGYYGFWNGETKYMLGVLSDKDFMINVVGESSPLLYAEGEYTDNGDGTYTATITSTDNDFAMNKTLTIRAEGGPDISITSDDTELNTVAAGSYTHAGESAADVDKLK